jgi:hypothetical protein
MLPSSAERLQDAQADRVIGDDPRRRPIAVGDSIKTLDDEAEPVEQDEDPR